jgi:hypothetical protein
MRRIGDMGDYNKKEDLTILVNSCDAYEDLWYPFFELFRINWPNCKYDIVLNTETKSYTHPKAGLPEIVTYNPRTTKWGVVPKVC